MAQVDKLNYIPLLFWFVILFSMIYILIMKRITPYFFSIFKARKKYYWKILRFIKRAAKLSCIWIKFAKYWSLYYTNKTVYFAKNSITQQSY